MHYQFYAGRTSILLCALMLAGMVFAQPDELLTIVDDYLEKEIGESSLPGAAVALFSSEEILYSRGFGNTRLEGGDPVTMETAFEIGSLTKSMTSLAILQLAEEGRLDIDDPVQTYLPWFRVADEQASREITIEQLLTHTSGLPTSSHSVVWQDYERIEPSITEGVEALAQVELTAAPGELLQYANMGYATLGAVIEEVTGEQWSDYTRARILEPLGMSNSGVTLEEQDRLDMATPYTWRLGRQQRTESMGPFVAPAGSLPVSSALDMVRYVQAWLLPTDDGVVTPTAARLATRPLVEVGSEHYGLGLVVTEQHGERVIYHTGGTIGSASYMAFLPERDLGVVVLSNSLSALAPSIGRGVIDIALGEPAREIGPDPAAIISGSMLVIGLTGLLLLGILAFRLRSVLRDGWRRRRRWVLVIRAALLFVVSAVLWRLIPMGLGFAGMPLPFGVYGYPVDMAVGAVSTLLVSSLWGVYALIAAIAGFLGSGDSSRSSGRSRGRMPAGA